MQIICIGKWQILAHVVDALNVTASHLLHLIIVTSGNKGLKVTRKYLFLFVVRKSMAVDGNLFATQMYCPCAFIKSNYILKLLHAKLF